MNTTLTKGGYADIICTRPCWYEGRNGETEWCVEHLWMQSNGGRAEYTTCDSDGDHTPFDGRGYRRYVKEAEQAWLKYAKWVAENGQDPLGNYFVSTTTKRKANWVFYWTSWIGASEHGLAVTGAKHGGKRYLPAQFPQYLKDYLYLKKVGDRYCMEGIHRPDDMAEGVRCLGNGYAKLQVEYEQPRNKATVMREVRKKAAAHLAEKGLV